MLTTVDFDREANGRAIKIQDICADCVMPTDTQATDLVPAQRTPKFLFSVRKHAPQPARLRDHRRPP